MLRRHWKWLVVGALAAACLALLIAQVSYADFIATLRRVDLVYAALGLAAALVCYVFKAWRFHLFLGPEARFGTVFSITVAQNVIAGLLPMRAGDVSYVVMVRAAGLSSVGYGVASLLVCRVLDFIILGAMYLLGLLWLNLPLAGARTAALAIGAILLLGIVGLAVLIFLGRRVTGLVDRLLEWTRLARWQPAAFIWREVKEGTLQLAGMRSPARLGGVVLLTAAVWLTTAAWVWFTWAAVGVPMNPAQIAFFTAVAQFFTLLPIFLPTGIGTGDALYAGMLIAFGFGTQRAAAFTLCTRVLTIIYVAVLAALALALVKGKLQPAAKEARDDGE